MLPPFARSDRVYYGKMGLYLDERAVFVNEFSEH